MLHVADTQNGVQIQLEALTSDEKFPNTPITMATATLTVGDRAQLFDFLHINSSRCHVVSGCLDRPNLFYCVQPVHSFNTRHKLQAFYGFLKRYFGLDSESWRTQARFSGIIYCATSVHCIDVAAALEEAFGPGYAQAIYNERHGMSKEQHRAIVERWLNGEIHVLVATVSPAWLSTFE